MLTRSRSARGDGASPACSVDAAARKLRRSPGGWSADWIFVDSGKVLSTWQTSHPDARRAMAGGADGAADALFKRYAKAGTAGPPGTYRLRILGIHGADDYLRLAGYLDGIAIVKQVAPVAASPEALEVDVDLATGLAGFNRYIARGDLLVPVAGDPADTGGPATFRLGGG